MEENLNYPQLMATIWTGTKMSYDYNFEPWGFDHDEEFRRNFFIECRSIFKTIGEEHMGEILYFFYTYESEYGRTKIHKQQHLDANAKVLLNLIDTTHYYSAEFSLDQLYKKMNPPELSEFMYQVNFNEKSYNEKDLLRLKDFVLNMEGLRIKSKKGIVIHSQPWLEFNTIKTLDKSFAISNELKNNMLRQLITDLINEQEESQTPFYEHFQKLLPDQISKR